MRMMVSLPKDADEEVAGEDAAVVVLASNGVWEMATGAMTGATTAGTVGMAIWGTQVPSGGMEMMTVRM